MIMARVDCEFLSVILARSYLGLESVTLVPICFGYQCMTLAPLPDLLRVLSLALIHWGPWL